MIQSIGGIMCMAAPILALIFGVVMIIKDVINKRHVLKKSELFFESLAAIFFIGILLLVLGALGQAWEAWVQL